MSSNQAEAPARAGTRRRFAILPLVSRTHQSGPVIERGAEFKVTAYCLEGRTASGVPTTTGIAAADVRVLPVGSVIQVDALGDEYDGIYTVMDTGSRVRGHTVDSYLDDCGEARELGHRDAVVTVLRHGWDPQAIAPPDSCVSHVRGRLQLRTRGWLQPAQRARGAHCK